MLDPACKDTLLFCFIFLLLKYQDLGIPTALAQNLDTKFDIYRFQRNLDTDPDLVAETSGAFFTNRIRIRNPGGYIYRERIRNPGGYRERGSATRVDI